MHREGRHVTAQAVARPDEACREVAAQLDAFQAQVSPTA